VRRTKIVQPKIARHLAAERRLFAHCIDAEHLKFGHENRENDTRQAATTADIEYSLKARAASKVAPERWHHRQAVR